MFRKFKEKRGRLYTARPNSGQYTVLDDKNHHSSCFSWCAHDMSFFMIDIKKAVVIVFLLIFSNLKCESSLAYTCPTDREDYFCRSVEAYPQSLVNEQQFLFNSHKNLFTISIANLIAALLPFCLT